MNSFSDLISKRNDEPFSVSALSRMKLKLSNLNCDYPAEKRLKSEIESRVFYFKT